MGRPSEAPLAALMGPGTVYEGDLTFDGRVRVEGTFRGRIYSEHLLEVAPTGVVEGGIDVARAVVSGQLLGQIRIREHLLVMSGGVVDGTLDAQVVELQPGARLIGQVRIMGRPS